MIAMEISVNGKRICIAGAEDLSVLGVNITAVGMLGKKTVRRRKEQAGHSIHYSVGGLKPLADPEMNLHMSWQKTGLEYLKIGDVVEVRVVECDAADRPKKRMKIKPRLHPDPKK